MIEPKWHRQINKLRMVVFDFDGVFTDNRVLVDETGRESVMCYRSDGIGLAQLRELGIRLSVISTEVNSVVQARCRKLNLPCISGCEDKCGVFAQQVREANLELVEVAFMGNDVNDRDCMRMAGLAVTVADAYSEIKELADIVTQTRGGYGAVREFCDDVYRIRRGRCQ